MIGFSSWDQALDYLAKPETQTDIDKVWVIGGGHVYKVDEINLNSIQVDKLNKILMFILDCYRVSLLSPNLFDKDFKGI